MSHQRRPSFGGGMSVDFLAAVIDHVAHPIFVKNHAFRYVLVNRAYCELHGFERNAVLGKTDFDVFPVALAAEFRRRDIDLFEAGGIFKIEEEPFDTRLEQRVLTTTKVAFHDESGKVTHVVGIINDLTRIKLAEETLRSANEELERRVRDRTAELRAAQEQLVRRERLVALGQLAGGVAHQLRNPLAVIQNAVSLLRRAPLEPAAQQAVDIVVEEVQRADGIIHALLDYARVRAAERCEARLRAIVDEALEQEHLPAAVSVALDVDAAITVWVDPLQVQSALGNVIRNAAEAMPRGGALTLSAERDGDDVLLTVRDTGQGVPEAARARLFDPLVTTKTQGVGLGLSTARNLIEAQGGSIEHGGEGPGATFFIRLPVDELPPSRR